MTQQELKKALDFALDVARQAGRVAHAHYQTGIATETKADASPVTAADRAAEALARRLIEERFPEHGIIGEEDGSVREDARDCWILDPIDGTRTFVRGVPLYGVLVALESEGEAVVGVMHFPALDETIGAARGLGCWWNGRRALVSPTTRLDQALLLTTDVEHIERCGRRDAWDRLRASAGLCRTWGDCYGYALVASGRAEAMFDPQLSIWDAAALAPIIEEAGGVFTDWDGGAGHRGGSGVATNAALAGEIRRILQDG